MEYLLQKVVWTLVQPSNLILLALALGLLALWLGRVRLGRGLVLAALVATLVLGFTPLASWTASLLEGVHPIPQTLPEQVDGIVVLGGAEEIDITRARGQVALNDASERLLGGLSLAREYPEAHLVFTGGRSAVFEREGSAAEVAGEFYRTFGVDDSRLLLEAESRDTYENALLSHRLVEPQAGEVWILVTSAWHMPRSVEVFTSVGWEVIPYPVDFRSTGDVTWRFTRRPLERVIDFDRIVTEWVGILAYRLAGRTARQP